MSTATELLRRALEALDDRAYTPEWYQAKQDIRAFLDVEPEAEPLINKKSLIAKEIHEACHDAMLQCPQFDGWDDDTSIIGWGEFGKIPNKGIAKTIMFWKEQGYLLWEYGYESALPEDIKTIFDEIDKALEIAINTILHPLNPSPSRKPMTEQEIDEVASRLKDARMSWGFIEGIRFAEKHHGIGGDDGQQILDN